MEGQYQKLHVAQAPAASLKDTAEGKYWRRFATPQSIQQVLVYDGNTHALKKTIARFPDTAHCGVFRSDGKLLAAGCESGIVQVFDASNRSILRHFKTHERPTHAVRFTPDRTHVLSGSDDATVRLWDLGSGSQVQRMDGHSDYVRCMACLSDTQCLTGSYDHTARLWDTRQKQPAMTLEHGAPVESVTTFLNGRIAATAGGTAVALWDLAAGGRALMRIGSHQKTVTSVSVVDVHDASGRSSARLLSSALDGHVKVYDLDTFKVAYAYKYPAPVMSAAVSPDLGHMAVGMADRTLVFRTHKRRGAAITAVGAGGVRLPKRQRSFAPRLTAGSYKYFTRGMNSKPTVNDVVVSAQRRVRLKAYDKHLKSFRYGEALDEALDTGQVAIVLSLVEELAAREGLRAALKSRQESSLVRLLAHLNKYAAHPLYARTVVQTVNCLLDTRRYTILSSAALLHLMHDLRSRLGAEVKVQKELHALSSAVDLVIS